MSLPGATGPTPPPGISFNDLSTNTNSLLADTATRFQQYMDLKSQRQTIIDQNTQVQATMHDRQQILNELNRMEQTYDEDYLERKAAPPQRSIMTILGLKTTQDKAIALFYLAYVLFSIAFTLYIVRLSTKKIIAGSFILLILTGVGILLTLGLVNYG
jgi:hypothetical protein